MRLKTADTVGTVELPVIAANRGRNPENPSDRTVGSPTEQRLEINTKGVSNALTTVQKDNYVLEAKEELGRMGRQAVETLKELSDRDVEPRAVKLQNSNMKGRRIKEPGEPMFTVTAHDRNAVTIGEDTTNFRIRKLSPLECWRLMGFKDLHFYKAQEVNSNSQLYKQAGNSIVVPVLEAIFKNMFAGGNR